MKLVGYRIEAKEFKGGLPVDLDFPAAGEKPLCNELNREPCFALVHGGQDVATQIWNSCRQSFESGTIAVLFFGEGIVPLPDDMAGSRFVRALSYRVFKGADPKPFLRMMAHVRGLEELPEGDEMEKIWELIDPGIEIRRKAAVEDLYPIILSGYAGETALTPEHQSVIKSHRDLVGECDDMETLQRQFEILIPWQDRRSHLSHNEFGHRFRLILERPSNRDALTAFLNDAAAFPGHLFTVFDRWPRIAADFDRLLDTACDEIIEEPSVDHRRTISDHVDAARVHLRSISQSVDEIRRFKGRNAQTKGPDLLNKLLDECRKFAGSIEEFRHIP